MPTNPLEFGRKGLQGRDLNSVPMFGDEPSIPLAASVVTAVVEPPAKPPRKNKKKGGTKSPL